MSNFSDLVAFHNSDLFTCSGISLKKVNTVSIIMMISHVMVKQCGSRSAGFFRINTVFNRLYIYLVSNCYEMSLYTHIL